MSLGIGIFVLAALLVAMLGVGARWTWLCVSRPPGWHTGPVCGRCGYRVGGLSELRCPECGTDLRVTGIITPDMKLRARGSGVTGLIGWTMFAAAIGALGLWGMGLYEARASLSRARATWPPYVKSFGFAPASGAFKRAELTTALDDARGYHYTVELKLVAHDGRSARLVLDEWSPDSPTVEAFGADGGKLAGVAPGTTEEHVGILMGELNIDSGPHADAEVAGFRAILRWAMADRYGGAGAMPATAALTLVGTSTSGGPASAPAAGRGVIGYVFASWPRFIIVTWLGGMCAIVIRRRSLHSQSDDVCVSGGPDAARDGR